MRILIIGAGGQGQVVADLILFASAAGQPIVPVGYLDDDPSLWQKNFLGLPVIGPIKDWQDVPHDLIILGIGLNQKRKEIYDLLANKGADFATVVHPKAIVGHDVQLGSGCYVGANVILAAGTIVGNNSIIHGNSVIGHHNRIGDHVHIAPGVNTAGNVTIGSGSMIGISATIMPQRKIGDWAVVGSATLVHRDVHPYATVVGVPGQDFNCKDSSKI